MEKNENEKSQANLISVAPVSRCSSFLCSETKTEAEQFQGALRKLRTNGLQLNNLQCNKRFILKELKDLRTQLHQAADYCEDAFLKEERKKMILDSTKSYICDAIVAVVDHLGTVSSKLELEFCNIAKVAQTEQRMDILRQRLLVCQQFAVTAELATIQYNEKLMQHHHHYVLDGQILKKHDPCSREEGDCQKIMDSRREEKLGLSGRFQHMEHGKHEIMILPGQNNPLAIGLKGTNNVGGDDKKKVQQGSNFLAFLSKNRKKAQLLRRRIG